MKTLKQSARSVGTILKGGCVLYMCIYCWYCAPRHTQGIYLHTYTRSTLTYIYMYIHLHIYIRMGGKCAPYTYIIYICTGERTRERERESKYYSFRGAFLCCSLKLFYHRSLHNIIHSINSMKGTKADTETRDIREKVASINTPKHPLLSHPS